MFDTIPSGAHQAPAAEFPPLTDLPRHSATLTLARETGRRRHEVAGLIVELAAWAADQQVDLAATPIAAEVLVDAIGADVEFWQAVAGVGWLKLKAPNAADAEGSIMFEAASCAHFAERLFTKLGITTDGRMLWKLAALMEAGRISSRVVWSAVEGVRIKQPKRPLAYLYAILVDELGRDKLNALLASVWRCPKEFSKPPASARSSPPPRRRVDGEKSKPREMAEILADMMPALIGGAR